MPNWKQELQLEIAGIEDVNANYATLTIRIDTLNDFFGGDPEVIFLQREMVVMAPEPVNLRLVDGVNYRTGDFLCQVAFLRLKQAFEPLPDDPSITINGVQKSLEEVRPFTAKNDWGLDFGDDSITIGGCKWTISGARGLKWLESEPSLIELTLRK